MQLCLGRAYRDAEHVARLFVAVAVNGVQHEYVPRALGKPVYGVGQVTQIAAVADRCRRGGHLGRDLDAVLFALRLADPAQYGVHRDAVHPGAERAVAAKPAELFPGLDEGFLRTVLGLADVARHAQAKAVDAVDVRPVKRLESPGVTRGRAGDECCLIPHRCRCPGNHACHIVAGFHRQKRGHPPNLPNFCNLDARGGAVV